MSDLEVFCTNSFFFSASFFCIKFQKQTAVSAPFSSCMFCYNDI